MIPKSSKPLAQASVSPTPDQPVISVRGLRRDFRRKRVLEGVDLQVAEGSVYALLGRNGVGKSTLSRCLLGLLPYDQGDVRILGRCPWKERRELMHDVAFALETPNVPPSMPVGRLLDLNRRLRSSFDEAGCTERLETWEVDRKRRFGSLSRGQQTRLCLQIALSQKPQLLILDDPTIGLDPLARREVYSDLVEALASSRLTILLTSHDTLAIESLATHVGLLQDGQLTVDEPLEALKERFRRLRSCGPRGEWPAPTPPPQPIYAETRSGWGCEWITGGYAANLNLPPSLEVDELSLEEIFAALHAPGDAPQIAQPTLTAAHVA